MNLFSKLLLIVLVCTAVSSSFAAKPGGGNKRAKGQEDTHPTNPGLQVEATQLTLAWHRLNAGLHDYQGHRLAAQQQTQLAGKALGLNFNSQPRPRLSQANSDSILREARALLQQVHTSLADKGKPVALQHIRKAIDEIDVALAIR